MGSLVSERRYPLPLCFFLTGSWEEESWRKRGAESLSEKKANRKRREARLISSQWGHSISVSAVSAWAAPKHETHSPCLSAACRASDNNGAEFATAPINFLSRNLLLEGKSPDSGRGRGRPQLLQTLKAAGKQRRQPSRKGY